MRNACGILGYIAWLSNALKFLRLREFEESVLILHLSFYKIKPNFKSGVVYFLVLLHSFWRCRMVSALEFHVNTDDVIIIPAFIRELYTSSQVPEPEARAHTLSATQANMKPPSFIGASLLDEAQFAVALGFASIYRDLCMTYEPRTNKRQQLTVWNSVHMFILVWRYWNRPPSLRGHNAQG